MKDDNKLREEAVKSLSIQHNIDESDLNDSEPIMFHQGEVIDVMIDFHKSQMESDAVEFAEYLGEKGFTKHKCGEQNHDGNNQWYDPEFDYIKVGTTAELYQLFLKSKNR